MRYIGGVALGVGLVVGLGSAARANVLCMKKSGAVFVRTGSMCKKKETLVDAVALGLQGPKGDPGTSGTPGTPGTNGTALAYAHVNADGTVDLANSKNITNANVSLQSTSAFCFNSLSFSFKNVIAVIDYGTGSTTTTSTAQAALGNPYSDCSSAQAEVATQDGSTFIPRAFFVIFN